MTLMTGATLSLNSPVFSRYQHIAHPKSISATDDFSWYQRHPSSCDSSHGPSPALPLLLGFSPLINIRFLTTQINKTFISRSLGLSPVVHTLSTCTEFTDQYLHTSWTSFCHRANPVNPYQSFDSPLFSQSSNFALSPLKPPTLHKCRRPAKSCGG